MSSFSALGVPADLDAVLTAAGRTEPFPIQRDTLPDSLAGRDVLGRGRTGSGKTLAFTIPLVARLRASRMPRRAGHPRGLVLAPTRELASQIADELRPLADAAGLRVTTVFGGVSQKPQEQALGRGVDIVVACPGRLDDLMKQHVASLDAIEITVLDEADHMADMGFLPVVTRILKATPTAGQRMLFSATLDHGIDTLVRRFLHAPVLHEVDESSVPPAKMTHRVFVVADADEKKALVEHLAQGLGRRILFTRTKHHAKKLAKRLTAAGIPAVDLQGNLSQNAREHNLAAFHADPAAGGVRVLVATDVAARGVHVDHVELVVHVDPPTEHKAYLHRSGRTARAGEEGMVVTVALESERRDVAALLRQAHVHAALEPVTAEGAAVARLVGERAPHVQPAPVAQPQQPRRAKDGAGRPVRGRGGASGRPETEHTRPSAGVGSTSTGGSRRRRSRGGAGGPARSGFDVAASTAPRAGDARGNVSHGSASRTGGPRTGGPREADAAAPQKKKQHRRAQSTPARPQTPQPGRTASGKPTIGAVVGSSGRGGHRRASYPGGR